MMTKLLKIAAVSANGFFRAGRFWSHAGTLVDPETLGTGVLERLRAERNLHITEASTDEAEAAQAEQLRDQVKGVIGTLDAEEFGEDGAPKVPAVRRALKGVNGITAALVAEVWAEISTPAD
jgi:hypothetical protein